MAARVFHLGLSRARSKVSLIVHAVVVAACVRAYTHFMFPLTHTHMSICIRVSPPSVRCGVRASGGVHRYAIDLIVADAALATGHNPFRFSRILRPLPAMLWFKFLSSHVKALVSSARTLIDVVGFLFLVMSAYAVIGVELLQGRYGFMPVDGSDSNGSGSGIGSSGSVSARAMYVGANETLNDSGYIADGLFDDWPRAMVTLFGLTTRDSYPYIMLPALAESWWYLAYFASFVLVSSFIVLNVFTAQVFESFNNRVAADMFRTQVCACVCACAGVALPPGSLILSKMCAQVREATAWAATFEVWATLAVGETSAHCVCASYPIIWAGGGAGGRDGGGEGAVSWAALRAHVRQKQRHSSVKLRLLAPRGGPADGPCDVRVGVAAVSRDRGRQRVGCCTRCRGNRGGINGGLGGPAPSWVRDKDAPLTGSAGAWTVDVGCGAVHDGGVERSPCEGFRPFRGGDCIVARFDGGTRTLVVESNRGARLYESTIIPRIVPVASWDPSVDADVRFVFEMGNGCGVEVMDIACDEDEEDEKVAPGTPAVRLDSEGAGVLSLAQWRFMWQAYTDSRHHAFKAMPVLRRSLQTSVDLPTFLASAPRFNDPALIVPTPHQWRLCGYRLVAPDTAAMCAAAAADVRRRHMWKIVSGSATIIVVLWGAVLSAVELASTDVESRELVAANWALLAAFALEVVFLRLWGLCRMCTPAFLADQWNVYDTCLLVLSAAVAVAGTGLASSVALVRRPMRGMGVAGM